MSGGARLVVVRPEPGNARTVVAARALGWAAEAMPLFAVVPLAWTPPDPAPFDALVLTSANTLRHGGMGLAALRSLPVLAVGAATAAAAREVGLGVALIGEHGGAALVAAAIDRGYRRLLHLGGRERIELPGAASIAVYASDPLPPPVDARKRLAGAIVLLHSARAARAVAALADIPTTAIAAISPAVLAAAGGGWRMTATAAAPTDAALLAAATTILPPPRD